MLRFKLPYLFAISLLVSVLYHPPAQAMGIEFNSLEKTQVASSSPTPLNASRQSNHHKPPDLPPNAHFSPLPIPTAASQPPTNTSKYSSKLPSNVLATTRVLTPPPIEALPSSRVLSPEPLPPKAIALSFNPDPAITPAAHPSPPPQPLAKTPQQPSLPHWIYAGGSNSLVARVIGSAEGTRTPSGSPTRAYYGHTDPGNGVWNMGTFSYQHGATSPQAADQKQLTRLKKQGKIIAKQANQARLTMSLSEILNGLDLANQAPRAALERGGYIDRLVQAREHGMQDSDAIVWARTHAYLEPDTQRWNAPGLGNTLHSIQRDQNRRHKSIANAFSHYQAQRAIERSPGETLPTPTVASSQQPLTTTPIEQNNPLPSEDQHISAQTPAQPVTFEVAAAPQSTHQTRQPPKEPITLLPNREPNASPATTTNSSTEDHSQASTNAEDGSPQIRS